MINYLKALFFGVVLLVACLLQSSPISAQNVALQPPKGFDADNNTWNLKLMFKRTAEARFEFSQDLTGTESKLIIGRNPNEYNVAALDVSGLNKRIIPSQADLNLPVGRYYVRVTNSSKRTFNEIANDTRPNLLFSNEVVLIVESNNAPRVIAPRGDTENGVPTFIWEPVSGVPAYWVLFSSTPFDISTNDNDEIEIKGANIVWQIITNNSSAQYGELNPDVAYNDQEAPPINPNQEYSFAILNVYEENNPVYASPVFGGIIPMRYINPDAIDKPVLISPNPDELFQASENITFSWTEVDGANSYGINLYQVITQQGVDATIPIWATTTTNTIIDYPASLNLKNSTYEWNIVAFDGSGGGTTSGNSSSPTRSFIYKVDNGEFNLSAVSTLDGQRITGVEVNIRAVQGGATPPIPSLLQADNISDSLVVGTYEFSASKAGFEDAVRTAEILKGRTTAVRFNMVPLPSFVEGVVVDETGAFVNLARVTARDLTTNELFPTDTDDRGVFSIPLKSGNYRIRVGKAGYQAPSPRIINVSANQNLQLSPNLILTNDRARISGTILNESGGAIQNARVRATKDDQIFDVRTDASGAYRLTLTSGVWTIAVTRNGFVPSRPRDIEFVVGDNLVNQNVTLAGRANTITGFIREQLTSNGVVVGESPFQNVTITATPTSGAPITTLSNSSGQYTLNLSSGSYVLTASINGYRSVTDPINMTMTFGETFSNINFVLTQNRSTVSGIARNALGQGLSGVTISIPNVGTTETGTSGTYSLRVPVGQHTVSANRSGYVSSAPRSISVLSNQTLGGVDFQLSANAAVVSGSVLSQGEIVTGATITATSTVFGSISTTTDDRGRFTLNLRPSSWNIVASRTGFLSSSPASLTLGAGQRQEGVQFSISPNTRLISGTVTSLGVPIRNAQVRLVKPEDESFELLTRTQSNGTYSILVEAGSRYIMTITNTGYRTYSRDFGLVSASSVSIVDNVSLTANPASISGVVSDINQQRLERVRVVAVRTSDNVRVDSVVTGINGNYSLGLPGGQYTIQAIRRGYSRASSSLTLQLGQNLQNINFSLNENFAFIGGVVSDGQGNPLENVRVQLTPLLGIGTGASATTTQNGTYSLTRIVGTQYSLSFSLDGYSASTLSPLTVVDGQQISQNPTLLARQGAIAGRVLDVNSNPVAEASVIAVKGEGDIFQTVSDDQGNYSFSNVDLTSYTIQAQKTGFSAPESQSVVLTPDDNVASDVTIENLVPNNVVISGRVTVQGENSALSGVLITVQGENGSGSATTAPDGTYSIQNLAPGQYTFSAVLNGFSFASVTVEGTSNSPQVSRDVVMTRNSGVLTGRVTDQRGQALPFRVNLRLVAEGTSYTTQSSLDGTFSFNEIRTGVTYSLSTEIFRDGYSNSSRTINYPQGQASVALSSALQVQANIASITGSTGIQGVAVTLTRTDVTPNSVVGVQISEPEGAFRFRNLAAGSYRVDPVLQGYIFNPTSSSQSLSFGQAQTITFTAQANVGTLTVNTTTNGTPISGVLVSVVSTDTTVILSGTSNLQGQASFASIPAGKTYIVRATLEGFSSNPASEQVSVAVNSSRVSSFTMSSNDAAIRGTVSDQSNNSGLSQTNVVARSNSSGQSFSATTNNSGAYAIGPIPGDTYELIFTRQGFGSDTLRGVSVANGQNLQGQNISLVPTSLRLLRGTVTYGNAGVEGAQVVLESSSTFTTNTNANGAFSFSSVPLLTGENDTTNYTITVSTEAYSASRSLQFTNSDLGRSVTLDPFVVPSGKIDLLVTDGINPLQGATVRFIRVGGTNQTELTTGPDGKFESSNQLRSSDYSFDISREGRLSPSSSFIVSLETDDSQVETNVALPFLFSPLSEISASDDARVTIGFTSGFTPQIASANIFYRVGNQTLFQSAAMTLADTVISGIISRTNGIENVVYYVELDDSGTGLSYSSPEYTITPTASGLLSRLRISPSINGQILRKDDEYTLQFETLDGINESLNDQFTSTEALGELTVSVRDDDPNIIINKVSALTYTLTASEDGNYGVRFTAELNGISVSSNITFDVSNVPIGEISVARPSTRVPNSESASFSYSARDTTGRRIFFGSTAEWSVIPPERGSITNAGLFTPANAQTIGSFAVRITDPISGFFGESDPVDLFAQLNPTVENTVEDGAGFQLKLPVGSLTSTTEITINPQRPETTKKYVYPSGSDVSYTVSDQAFRIISSIAEIGEGAVITIPTDSTLRFLDGNKVIGRYDQAKLEWELLTPTSASKQKASGSASTLNVPIGSLISGTGFITFGQFAVLSENDPLTIKHTSALPNPFSPVVGPVKIGYALTSDAPPASVTITIFNVRGERIRTLLENDLQFPGRVGSSSSQKEITWDGLTDNGNQARNGRYVVQIKAKDANREVTKLLQIVLVK